MKTARKNIADCSAATVATLARIGFDAAKADLADRVLEMIAEDGSMKVREIVKDAKAAGWARADINTAIDCAREDEDRFEMCGGDLIVR